jgi:hypothetical protein
VGHISPLVKVSGRSRIAKIFNGFWILGNNTRPTRRLNGFIINLKSGIRILSGYPWINASNFKNPSLSEEIGISHSPNRVDFPILATAVV